MSKVVFISYSHDSPEHREKVLELSERLRADGIKTLFDRYVNGSPPEGWPRWMLNQLDEAQFVLVVCTEIYYRRFRGHEEPGKGKGVDWEGALITQEIYDSRSRTLKFVPVLLPTADTEWIPEPLRSITYYALTSEEGYRNLYDFLVGQSGVEPAPIGQLKTRERARGKPLTFVESEKPICQADISRINKYAPACLIGRENETQRLDDAWYEVTREEKGRPRIITFVALGGEGKTSLVAKWLAELAAQDWPGCAAAFAWSFYSQGTRERPAASSDLFLKEALVFFASNDEDREFAASPAGGFEKGQRLARLIGQRKSLLILDGLEPLQYAPTAPTRGELKDQGIAVLLKGLATTNHGLCVVTTRYSLPDLKAFWQTTAPEVELQRLSREAGAHLLQTLGVTGSLLRNIPWIDGNENLNEFEKLVEDVKGHALTLNLLGTYLRDAHGGDIRKRDLVQFEEADAEEQGGHAFRVMDAYSASFENEGKKGQRALAVLRLLGLFDRPAIADCLAALLKAPAIPGLTEPLAGVSEAQRNMTLTRLEAARLLTVNRDGACALVSLDAHPLLREYFARQLFGQQPDAWRAAHRRLYEHLCASTKDLPQPTLEDLQPLYQTVAHGCQAGLQRAAYKEVYLDRIARGARHYATRMLGACGSDLGAVACFFEAPWSRVSSTFPETDRAMVLGIASFNLRALGRLTEALEPMRAALKSNIAQKNWGHAASNAGNLSELELTLGEVAVALEDAKQSVTYADRSGDAHQRVIRRTTHAAALHQSGRRAEAEGHFREAEQMQTAHPILYSQRGFQYCDLLLAAPERDAWQQMQKSEVRIDPELIQNCRAVAQRAEAALRITQNGSRNAFDIGLGHLTLGRAALYEALMNAQGGTRSAEYGELKCELNRAVASLRRAGQQGYLPLGLLTRAWLRFLTGARTGPESTQADLEEAREIAERGPMRLITADIHLYRARLFFREADYPWASPRDDLAAARKLIEECGYGRREEELKDAEAAIAPPAG